MNNTAWALHNALHSAAHITLRPPSANQLRAMTRRCKLRGGDCPCVGLECPIPGEETKRLVACIIASEQHEKLPDNSPFSGI